MASLREEGVSLEVPVKVLPNLEVRSVVGGARVRAACQWLKAVNRFEACDQVVLTKAGIGSLQQVQEKSQLSQYDTYCSVEVWQLKTVLINTFCSKFIVVTGLGNGRYIQSRVH